MLFFNKIISLSKRIAASLLKDEKPNSLKESDLFDEKDKEYVFKNLTNKFLIRERQIQESKIDAKNDLLKLTDKLNLPIKKTSWHYKVAAIILVLVGTSFFLNDSFYNSTNIKTTTISVSKTEIGTDKATLTLEDGSNVELVKGSTFQKDNVISNGEELVYNSLSNEKESAIRFNYLTVPRGGQFNIKLSDGTIVWLNSESQLKYPITFRKGAIREVELVYGEAYFDVSPSTAHNGDKFRVKNKEQVVEVFGTEFNVKSYKEESVIYTTLVEGSIEIAANGEKSKLIPNQQSILNKSTSKLSIKTVDVYSEIAWREGVFSFENKSLKEIMVVLSRWYDIEVFFGNDKLQLEQFNGVLGKNQDLEEILMIIKNFKIIEGYKIDEKRVILK